MQKLGYSIKYRFVATNLGAKGRLLGAWLACLLLAAMVGAAQEAGGQAPSVEREKTQLEVERERLEANKQELRQIKLVDSVGWIKVTAIKRPDTSMSDLSRERMQRKISALLGFCEEKRFANLSEVDRLDGMMEDEKRFCKERLKIINPLVR